jgi:hypothetical protein
MPKHKDAHELAIEPGAIRRYICTCGEWKQPLLEVHQPEAAILFLAHVVQAISIKPL